MFKDSGQFVVNGRKVRGKMDLCADSRKRLSRSVSESACLFSLDGSVYFKLFDLIKYARINYGLTQEETRLLFILSMSKRGFLNKSDLIILSGLNDVRCINCTARLVEVGYFVEFNGQRVRSKRRGITYTLSSSGLAVLEDCFRYWDDVLKFRSM